MFRILSLFLFSSVAFSATLVTDPTTQTVTHCRLIANNVKKPPVPVKVDATGGKYCAFVIDAYAPGEYDFEATFINNDGTFVSESPRSNLVHVTRPALPLAPTNLIVK